MCDFIGHYLAVGLTSRSLVSERHLLVVHSQHWPSPAHVENTLVLDQWWYWRHCRWWVRHYCYSWWWRCWEWAINNVGSKHMTDPWQPVSVTQILFEYQILFRIPLISNNLIKYDHMNISIWSVNMNMISPIWLLGFCWQILINLLMIQFCVWVWSVCLGVCLCAGPVSQEPQWWMKRGFCLIIGIISLTSAQAFLRLQGVSSELNYRLNTADQRWHATQLK